MKLSLILELTGIKNLDIDEDIDIKNINTIKDASKDEISFLDNQKYLQDLKDTKAKAVFITEDLKQFVPDATYALQCKNPYLAMAKTTKLFAKNHTRDRGADVILEKGAKVWTDIKNIGYDTKIGQNSIISRGVVIGNDVSIGKNCIIYPNVVIYDGCKIGDECIIHANTVIGSDGFGFAVDGKEYTKIYHNGIVNIKNNVEIGSNTSIDRAVFDETYIGENVRIDNLVHIAHNCYISEGCIITGQCGFAGSSKLGEYVIVGAQSGVAGHLQIAPFSTISARSGVTKTITKSHKQWTGFPIMEHKVWLKIQAKIQKMFNKNLKK